MKNLLMILIFTIFVSGCSSIDPDAIVATIGDEKIYFDEFELYAAPQVRKPNLMAVSDENKERLFKNYVELAVLADLAKADGLAEEASFVAELAKKRRIWVAQYFYWDVIVNELFTEKEISEYYDKMDSEFSVRHIIIGYNGAANSDVTRTKDEALILIKKVYEKAVNGESDFKTLATEFSEGPSASQGGALPKFGPGKMEKSFETAVFNMEVGDICKPIETKYGYHIIMLEGIDRKIEPVSLADANERVRTYQSLLNTKNKEAQILFKKITDSLLTLIDFSYDDENIDWFSAEMVKLTKRKDFAQAKIIANEADLERTLFKTSLERYTVANLLDDLGTRARGYVRRMTTSDEVKRGLRSFSSIYGWYTVGKREGYDKERWVIIQESNFVRNELGNIYRTTKIRPTVEVSEEEIVDFYQRNIDRYQIPAKIEVSVIRQADIEIAAAALKRATAGEDWKSLVKEYSQGSKFEKDRAGLLGMKKEADFGDVTKKAFEFGPDKIVPELVLNGNTFFIVKTGKKTSESVRPLEKVKKDIRSAVSLRNEHRIMDKIVEDKKEKDGFSYNPAAIML